MGTSSREYASSELKFTGTSQPGAPWESGQAMGGGCWWMGRGEGVLG